MVLFLLSFMWRVYAPVLTEDALPCFADCTSIVFSISIIAIWEEKKSIHIILHVCVSLHRTTDSLNMTEIGKTVMQHVKQKRIS